MNSNRVNNSMFNMWGSLMILWCPSQGPGQLSASTTFSTFPLDSIRLHFFVAAFLGGHYIAPASPKLQGSLIAPGLHFHQQLLLGSFQELQFCHTVPSLTCSTWPFPAFQISAVQMTHTLKNSAQSTFLNINIWRYSFNTLLNKHCF